MTVMAGLAGLQRQMRGNLLEELRQLYVTTARAKGLPEHKVIYKHAVRNAINPMVTYLGYLLTALISSSALVEIIFAYPGVGKVMLEAVLNKDLYVVMGSMMLGGTLLLIGNVIADILLAVVDPRIRYD
jgi:peptide/nickel transport system permease protein